MTKVTKKVEDEFLSRTAKGEPMIRACRALNVSRMAIYRLAKRKPTFASAWKEAKEDGRLSKVAEFEDEADKRAIKGAPDPIYYKGKRVGWRVRKSDSLLLARLKALDPDTYADHSKVDATVNEGHSIKLEFVNADEPDPDT